MNALHTEGLKAFDAFHFASEYERYAALIIGRVCRAGRGPAARILADSDVRDLLALPERPDGVRQRKRLSVEELDALAPVVELRLAEIQKLGSFNAPLFSNVRALGDRLDLPMAERELLILAVMVDASRQLSNTMDELARFTRDRGSAARTLAALLDHGENDLHAALLPTAKVLATDLVRVNFHEEDEELLRARPGLAAILFDEFSAPDALFARFARRARAPSLSLADYSHLDRDTGIIVSLLRAAVREREKGINVLLYGPPGTGKTELARVLTHEASAELHEVRHTDAEGNSLTRARYAQVLLAQTLLGAVPRCVLLFDETEDLLPANRDHADHSSNLGKAAFNQLLETNQAPMIWISNHIAHIDPAYLRRFAYVLEVKNPNRAVRRRIAQRAFGDVIEDSEWVDSVANHTHIVPGQITQAARVVRLTRFDHDPIEIADRTMRNSMRALGQKPAGAQSRDLQFDLRYLNCNLDVEMLVENLAHDPRGSLVLYGPPGTGKTALAHHLASKADRPLLLKRASDLLSPWVGESERAIAAAFEEARDERAVLVIDEAESFLSDRRDARARWELTETNELLTQMEDFDGLLVCSTNLIERLDRAALRRFAVKLRFDFLRAEQIRLFIGNLLQRLGLTSNVEEVLSACQNLKNVTPGDVAAVTRRMKLLSNVDAPSFVNALREELALKCGGAVQRIGF